MPLTPQGPGSHTGLPMGISESSLLSNPAGGAPALHVGGTTAAANNIMASFDGGLTWARCTVPNPGATAWWGMAYSPSLNYSIATSSNGVVVRTLDGITWSLVPGEDLTNGNWRRMVRNLDDSLFVVVGLGGVAGQRVATSPDGVTWTLRNTPNGPQSSSWTDMFMNPVTGRIWCLTSAAFLQPFIFSDDGGITWAYGNALAANDGGSKGFGSDSGLANGFLRFTGGGTIDLFDYFSTDDGVTWTAVDSNPPGGSSGVWVGINEDDNLVLRGNTVNPCLETAGYTTIPPPNPWTTVDAARAMASPSAGMWSEEWGAWILTQSNGTVYRSTSRSAAAGSWVTLATGALTGNSTNILASPLGM